jgi:predicted RNA-binding Zn-ribbon protein involved in translation (DUF1610 family)
VNTTTLVILGVIVLIAMIALYAFAGRSSRASEPTSRARTPEARGGAGPDPVESPLIAVPEQAVREAETLVPVLLDEGEHPVAVSWLVDGYCMKDRKMVGMVNPQPITMKNGKPATVGLCPQCGTKIYRIGKSTVIAMPDGGGEHPVVVTWLVEGYCLKDRKKVEMMNPRLLMMKNGSPATAGLCPHCGTKIYRIGRSPAPVENMVRAPLAPEWIQQGRWETV